MQVSRLLGKSTYIKNVGKIYPVQAKSYDQFHINSDILYISKKNFDTIDLPLLVLLLNGLESAGISKKIVIQKLINTICIILRLNIECLNCHGFFQYYEVNTYKNHEFCPFCDSEDFDKKIEYFESDNALGFRIDKRYIISHFNYDEVREVIMQQNLLYEPKIFKNKMVQQWAEKVILAKAKNSADISFDDMIDTIHIYTGIPYSELQDETIYQIRRDFERTCKIKKYESDILFQTVDTKKRDIEHFAERIIFKNPYEDLFVKKDKLNKLNEAMK